VSRPLGLDAGNRCDGRHEDGEAKPCQPSHNER
jgi:hypothetical protein